jgi:hypothetical protein
MSFKESNVNSNGSSVTEYEKDKTKLLYCTMKDVSTGSCNYIVK